MVNEMEALNKINKAVRDYQELGIVPTVPALQWHLYIIGAITNDEYQKIRKIKLSERGQKFCFFNQIIFLAPRRGERVCCKEDVLGWEKILIGGNMNIFFVN